MPGGYEKGVFRKICSTLCPRKPGRRHRIFVLLGNSFENVTQIRMLTGAPAAGIGKKRMRGLNIAATNCTFVIRVAPTSPTPARKISNVIDFASRSGTPRSGRTRPKPMGTLTMM